MLFALLKRYTFNLHCYLFANLFHKNIIGFSNDYLEMTIYGHSLFCFDERGRTKFSQMKPLRWRERLFVQKKNPAKFGSVMIFNEFVTKWRKKIQKFSTCNQICSSIDCLQHKKCTDTTALISCRKRNVWRSKSFNLLTTNENGIYNL